MIQSIPIKQTRDQLADLINQVDIAGRSFIITKFGKPKAMLTPLSTPAPKTSGISASFGIWKDRKDIKNTDAWVRKTRTKLSLRK